MDVDVVTELEATLASDRRYALDENRALVSLCRLLARQIEEADKPSTHLTASYLSALKDLGRILTAERRPASASSANDDGLDTIRAKVTALRSV